MWPFKKKQEVDTGIHMKRKVTIRSTQNREAYDILVELRQLNGESISHTFKHQTYDTKSYYNAVGYDNFCYSLNNSKFVEISSYIIRVDNVKEIVTNKITYPIVLVTEEEVEVDA